ncbi:MAG: lipopolysaccharide kinase InaA family protein [Candidatus Bathyarchaeia archaeon]
MVTELLGSDLREKIIEISLKESAPENVIAIAFYGPYAGGYADDKAALDILAITESEKIQIKSRSKTLDSKKARLLIASRRIFENDVESEWLGGIIAENILAPYKPLLNERYLWIQEVKAKKRIISEALNNLILGFPELSRNFMIKPEYFMFESMARRAALFPLITYRFINILRGGLRETNRFLIMKGFNAAIEELVSEGKIYWVNDYLKISEDYIESLRGKRGIRLINFFRNIRSSIIRYVLTVFPTIIDSLLDDYRIYRLYKGDGGVDPPTHMLEDPKKYISIPTSSGTVLLSEKVTIEEFVRRTMPESQQNIRYEVKRLGGILNSVYKLRVIRDGGEEKFVVKIFKDWYGWKWFPLALWSLGTRGFAVLGKARLEREYSLNNYLLKSGVNVPKIICVSPSEKLLFQEYIEGKRLSEIIKQLYKEKDKDRRERLLSIIRRIGREIARIHLLGISLGDCKSENIILSPDDKIFFIDLEQAEVGGSQAWDIAEFLYYPGHYAIFSSIADAEIITREFLLGYLEAGGRIENIRRALSPRYIKVFSFFTPPHIIVAVSNVCRKILRDYVSGDEKIRPN